MSARHQQSWWYSLFFVVGAVAVWVRSEGRLFRTGVILFAVRYAVAAAEVAVLGAIYPKLRLLLSIASAVAFFAAGWRVAWPWARITSCIAFLVLSPFRYRVLESVAGTRSVVGDAH